MFGKVPSWVKRQIDPSEAKALSREIQRSGAKSAIEIGVASGFSSAVIYSALRNNTSSPKLYAFDLSPQCYYDKQRETGAAFGEICGEQSGYVLKTGVDASQIEMTERADFLFIDANHQNPWPSLDLISLSRFIQDGAIVALHDYEMVYHSWGRHASGVRDLYRAWRGEKYRYADSSNLAFLVFDRAVMWKTLPTALRTDWDTSVNPDSLRRFKHLIRKSAPLLARRRVLDAIYESAGSEAHFKPKPVPTS